MNIRDVMTQMQHGMPSQAPVAAPATAPAAPKPKGNPGAALKAAHAAHAKGDHAGAKRHALQAVNALHRMAGC